MNLRHLRLVIGTALALCWSGGTFAQQSLTTEQIIDSLQAKAPSPSRLSADEILDRIKNLVVVEPNGIPSPKVAEIAPLVTDLPSVSMEI
jgi:hypothetical protein